MPIKLIAASPFEGFEERWPGEWRKRYHKVLEKADLIRYISPHYYTGCFQVRNEWMVDHSAIVIAVWNGEKSGTANMVSYANHQQTDVINVL